MLQFSQLAFPLFPTAFRVLRPPASLGTCNTSMSHCARRAERPPVAISEKMAPFVIKETENIYHNKHDPKMGPWGFFWTLNSSCIWSLKWLEKPQKLQSWHLHDLRLWSLFHLRLLRQVSDLSMASSNLGPKWHEATKVGSVGLKQTKTSKNYNRNPRNGGIFCLNIHSSRIRAMMKAMAGSNHLE